MPPTRTGGVFQVLNIDQRHVGKVLKAVSDLEKRGVRVTAMRAAGGPISGTKCKTTGGTFNPDDFNCGDSD